jgi:hypothetical protein
MSNYKKAKLAKNYVSQQIKSNKTSRYNRQLVIATVMQDSNESSQILNAVNKGIQKGLPTEFVYLSEPSRDLYGGSEKITKEFVEKHSHKALYPGQTMFFQDKISQNVIESSKSIDGKSITIKAYENLSAAKKSQQEKLVKGIGKLDHNSRLYVVGHGRPGGTEFSHGGGGTAITYANLTKLIASNSKLKAKSNSPITISLISCSAGVGNEQKR